MPSMNERWTLSQLAELIAEIPVRLEYRDKLEQAIKHLQYIATHDSRETGVVYTHGRPLPRL